MIGKREERAEREERAVHLSLPLWNQVESAANAAGKTADDWTADILQRVLNKEATANRLGVDTAKEYGTITVKEAAAILNVTVNTVRTYLHTGAIQGVKAGGQWRITPESLKAFIGR